MAKDNVEVFIHHMETKHYDSSWWADNTAGNFRAGETVPKKCPLCGVKIDDLKGKTDA